ncbi:hypothetical protein LPTSP4_26990 [Leptospira ryugenii]|uniref:Uncharacterized protein n=1 Tax=Leptospira ryugenii TaxID=1917863 RepID=A0A2P2E2R2_9LEPT|nr:tetratricopeptide repeat protein [Leptospira ryugenii]GBF51167.1 hypothetical protein LPTSP4_26990 [Leptospira ryugenii]
MKQSLRHILSFLLLSILSFQTQSAQETLATEDIALIQRKIELEKTGRNIINALRFGKFALADQEWKRIQAEEFKTEAEYYYLAGALMYSRLDWQDAKEFLQKSLSLEPSHEASSFLLGMIFAQADNWKQAKQVWVKTIEISPYNPFYHYNLGLSYYILAEYDKAIESLSKSLEYKPNYLEAKIILAKTYLELGELLNAKNELESILEIEPKNQVASNLYGRAIYEMDRDPKKALSYLKNDKILGWREKRIYARCYFEIRKWRESEALFRTIAYSPFADEFDQSFYLNLLLNLGLEEKANDFFHFTRKQDRNNSNVTDTYKMLLSSREGKTLLYHYFKLRY